MRISVFTDEICPASPEQAIHLAAAWGLTHVEVRSLPGGRFPAVADGELERLSVQVREAGLAVSGVSPGFFKCSPDDPSIGRALSDGLPRACEWARRLGTDMVTCFAFHRVGSGDPPAAVVDLCGEMAAIARRHGCRLALENEAGCWGATGVEAASLIRQLGSEHISLCWDPGNACKAGSVCPYPDEYQDIRDLVSHVHMKSFDPATGSWCLMDEGAVNWAEQLGALAEDEYDGFLVIETHLHVSPDQVRIADAALSGLQSNTLRNLLFVRSCLEQA
ncbi:MAG: sugar phosphate isomerase/epimerase [Lentisphaerae bacterium]|jgi:L-ribulose-5-phosphate 3-epimerase|nr:sugar phosphate isomerase/epimerase [Lentisphaerota bacterium]MBT4818231.1 sugar phosphate isomerase/epimerase [Lentisphaerota bacterium]MBT5613014.1 sugar phosphate isomerase/epimerase [Lentisphaerota bacterium]MBT7056740.1 sugar phosphate isomerase/epimerase [Lentisphaerota bacterium]MBT7843742.1 sugar phosphate isomerase/epimerase [Lentisphaerota bacterium]